MNSSEPAKAVKLASEPQFRIKGAEVFLGSDDDNQVYFLTNK